MANASPPPRNRSVLIIAGVGLLGGLLITGLEVLRYRYLLVAPSLELLAGLTAALFAALGLWLGRSLHRGGPAVVVREVPVAPAASGDFVRDEDRARKLGLTPRELETLGLVAEGLSNRQIAGRLFVSENTVKTHLARAFSKLGVRRRTQAVRVARKENLIP